MRYLSCAVFCAIFVLGVGLETGAAAETALKRGAYLVNGIAGCGNCHTPRGGPMKGKALVGGNSFGGAKGPFHAYAANITQDRETGIGTWTDKQIIVAIREGKRPDGTVIGPPMPIELYNHMSDTDVKAIVAYLRTVKAVKHKVKSSVYRIPLHAEKPAGHVPDVPKSNPVRYGAYLAGPVGHCIECHTPLVKGRLDLEHQLGRGGRKFPGPWGISVSRNITPHPEDGLGKWTDAQIKRAIQHGVEPDGTKLHPPMAYRLYRKVSAGDMNAIVAYLRSLKPLASK